MQNFSRHGLPWQSTNGEFLSSHMALHECGVLRVLIAILGDF